MYMCYMYVHVYIYMYTYMNPLKYIVCITEYL